ncbi:MAG TPA: hypothetical protein P5307_06060 [Pirellulaceae bacterium]|nr:hypothetical protein [Pirellulaceae bacterium]
MIVLALFLIAPAVFIGCGPQKMSSDEIPMDIGDVSEEEGEDADAPEEE